MGVSQCDMVLPGREDWCVRVQDHGVVFGGHVRGLAVAHHHVMSCRVIPH